MVTAEQMMEYLERVIAEYRLAGNVQGLRNAQTAAGFMMEAAQAAGDKDSAYRFRVLAAQAANKREELSES
jgi:hypothetical protein